MDLFEAAGVVAGKHRAQRPARPPEREFDADELAWFAQCPVGELATWSFDLRETDDDLGRRSRMSRQIAAIIKRRGIADAELGPAREEHIKANLFRSSR